MSAFVNIFIDHEKNKIICEGVVDDTTTDKENAYVKEILSDLSSLALEDHNPPAVFDLGTKISIIEIDEFVEVDIIDNGKDEIIGGETVISFVLANSVLERLNEKYGLPPDDEDEDEDYDY